MELIETGRTRDFAAAIADPAREWRPMTSVESGDRAFAQPRARVEGVTSDRWGHFRGHF